MDCHLRNQGIIPVNRVFFVGYKWSKRNTLLFLQDTCHTTVTPYRLPILQAWNGWISGALGSLNYRRLRRPLPPFFGATHDLQLRPQRKLISAAISHPGNCEALVQGHKTLAIYLVVPFLKIKTGNLHFHHCTNCLMTSMYWGFLFKNITGCTGLCRKKVLFW